MIQQRDAVTELRLGNLAACALQEAGCAPEQLQRAHEACRLPRGGRPLDRQFLFTVYVHPHLDFPGYGPRSVFYRREVADRIPVGPRLTTSDRRQTRLTIRSHCSATR